MTDISSFILDEKIYEGTRSSIYRGTQTRDDRSVVIKTHSSEYPTQNEIERLCREFEIVQKIADSHIIQYISLENSDHGFAIIEEEFHAEALAGSIPENGFEPVEFLKIAIQLAEGLNSIHLKNIIHRDINPHNILINNQSGNVKYIDFSRASLIEREIQQSISSEIPQSSLAYISPEQSGRMNRAIDHRADLYSLGITFYELLTGHLPFNTTDYMELVHCHIAKNPLPPCELKKDVPEPISDIVIKLLAKNAEDRYQSSSYLKADLEECLNQMETVGRIESFTLGHQYPSDIFYIAQKLYGRKTETKSLTDVFNHISQGRTEILLVRGYSGIGKTTLVKEMQKAVTAERGNFITGEFDQLARNVAYSAIIQAFQGLVRQILSQSEQMIQDWRGELLSALGTNGQIIIDLVPEVELIIGRQPPVPELGPTETRNRFNLFFKRFIQVFTRKDRPLVLFLDNLQWADSASLNLIKNITTDFELNFMLLIGAYRDNEVDSQHPTKITINEIRNARGIVHDIHLSPLEVPDINHFITDTLGLLPEKTQNLAELVHHKTRGNPFFVKVFLQSLHNDGLIYFSPPKSPFDWTESESGWQWDMEAIGQVPATDNVADFLVDRINQLPEPTIAILKMASCMGSAFNLGIVSKISGRSREGVLSDLDPALILGMILQTEDNFSFVQSRIREAAFSLISDKEKKVIHLKTGWVLLENTHEEKLEEKIFDIVNQLNLAEELITSQEERNNLAVLNLKAGLKAKASSAYEEAKQFFLKGAVFLSGDAWENEYKLILALHTENCEAGNLTDDYEQTDKFFDSVIENARTPLDKVRVYEAKMADYWVFNKITEAWELAKDALNMLGLSIPQKNLQLAILKEKIWIKLNIGRKKVDELINLPDLKDPNELAIARIIMHCTVSSYSGENRYFPIMVLKLLNLTLNHGNSTYAAYAYAIYGAYLCSVPGDIEQGYRFGKLALKVLEKFDDKQLKCKVYHIFGSRINHWKKHIRENVDFSLEAYKSASETGDLQYMCFAGSNYLVQSIFMGETFDVIRERLDRYRDVMVRSAQLRLKSSYNCWYQLVATLSSEVKDNASVKVEEESGPEWAEQMKELFLSYLLGDYKNAIKVAEEGKKSLNDTLGLVAIPEYYFYYSLALLAHYSDADREKQKKYLKIVKRHQNMMKKWAGHAPDNHEYKYVLVEAEKSRLLGSFENTLGLYEKVIALARRNQFLHVEALANELSAKYCLSKGMDKFARVHIHAARYEYNQWGAGMKVKELDEQYSKLLSSRAADSLTTRMPEAGGSINLDLSTIAKATQAISSEIDLEKLLVQILKIIIENAGAQKGLLILESNSHLRVEAACAADSDEVEVLQSIPLEDSPDLSESIVRYVFRAQENVILSNALQDDQFAGDPYITENRPKSILCIPIRYKDKVPGVLYLENNLTADVFTEDRLEIIHTLLAHAAISLENARLYSDSITLNLKLRERIEERDRATESLRLSEEMFSKAFESSPNGIFITSLNDGRFMNVNESFLQSTGYDRDEILGKSYVEVKNFINPEEASRMFRTLKKQGYLREHAVEFQIKSGEICMGMISAEVIELWDESCMLATVEDVTESNRLEKEIMDISERERQKIGQELHDDLGPHLIGIEVMTKVLKQKLEKQSLEESESAEKIRDLIKEASNKTRKLARGLSPVTLVSEGLESALNELAVNMEEIFGISCIFNCKEEVTVRDNSIATNLFYIAQEAVHNAVRHGAADVVNMELSIDNGRIILEIKDNGPGIPEKPDSKGMGLRIMGYRTKMIGGSLELGSDLNGGAKVTVVLKNRQT